jgi:hypothetical protein
MVVAMGGTGLGRFRGPDLRLPVKVGDFLLERHRQFIRSAPQLAQSSSQRPSDFRELLGSEEQKSYKKYESDLGEAAAEHVGSLFTMIGNPPRVVKAHQPRTAASAVPTQSTEHAER